MCSLESFFNTGIKRYKLIKFELGSISAFEISDERYKFYCKGIFNILFK